MFDNFERKYKKKESNGKDINFSVIFTRCSLYKTLRWTFVSMLNLTLPISGLTANFVKVRLFISL